jgi:hypothetical protein
MVFATQPQTFIVIHTRHHHHHGLSQYIDSYTWCLTRKNTDVQEKKLILKICFNFLTFRLKNISKKIKICLKNLKSLRPTRGIKHLK